MTWRFSTWLTLLVDVPSRFLSHLWCSIFRSELPKAVGYDDPLLKAHTDFERYNIAHARITYPSIRTFYHPHAHADKLKVIADLPLFVFVHGLGGCIPQFVPLLGSFVNIAPCFGIELPGHGSSDFAPNDYEAYSFDVLVQLWSLAIERICSRHGHNKIVIVAHSMGCSIGAMLASTSSKLRMGVEVVGFVALCPKATPPTQSQVKSYRRALMMPDFVLDILRFFDRMGGEESKSVRRFVGKSANDDLKRLQLQLNRQFITPVWKRTSLGLLPQYTRDGTPHGGMPGKAIWEGLQIPLLVVAGETDLVTEAHEALDIVAFVKGRQAENQQSDDLLPLNPDSIQHETSRADDETYGLRPSSMGTKNRHFAAVKSVILPAPATHALMYDHSTYRTVAGLMEDFLSEHISHKLEPGWQLQQLTTSGKWDVKNLEKWRKVLPVSGPIDDGLFRALKTLREQDEGHTPTAFLEQWEDKIYAIIDISHDSPIYDTKTLERGGIEYHKFPTVSKIPPTLVEVHNFIALVDRLRNDMHEKNQGQKAIGVHCHYGYNRTGFFIVCYLVEKKGYTVQSAIEEFGRQKPPGIKHDHFIDTLFVRYCVGLKRSSISK